jgi:hypothetical protein
VIDCLPAPHFGYLYQTSSFDGRNMDVERLVARELEKRIGAFLLGGLLWFFYSAKVVFTAIATARCSIELWDAIIAKNLSGAPNVVSCLASGALAAMSGSAAAGLALLGGTKGWQFVFPSAQFGDSPPQNGKRDETVHTKIFDKMLGVSHNWDQELLDVFNAAYSPMLNRHNATLISISWLECVEGVSVSHLSLESFNMTNGRIIALNDNGDNLHRCWPQTEYA